MRVDVWNGDKSQYLGQGTLIGKAIIYGYQGFQNGNPIMYSNPDSPEKPMPNPPPNTTEHKGESPKIKLDSGQIVYGCQTWWSPVQETETVKQEEPCLETLTGLAEAAFEKYNLN